MQNKQKSILFFLVIFSLISTNITAKHFLQSDNFEYSLTTKFKPESFFGKNINLLNSVNEADKIWFSRHTLDLNFNAVWGLKTYDEIVAETKFTWRNKGVWGDPGSIARTTNASIKELEVVGGAHTHSLPRHIVWIREGWLEFDLSDALSLPFENRHTFKIGAFPFQLGRGIALGDAYAVGPEILGFYTDYAVDQYAFGGKFGGDIVSDRLSYDLYASILENKSGSTSQTGAKIFGQAYDRLKTPQRGFGHINFLVASRVKWSVFNNNVGKLEIEPYALYNSDPEQEVEFPADASAKIGTFGLAAEFEYERFEFGFDYAQNVGQQRVRGWDRNQTQKENRNGQVILSNTHVVNAADNSKIPYITNSDAQKLINETFRSESQNGRNIGTVDSVGFVDGPVTLQNASNRFRDPYTNKLEGWMFVTDVAWWLYKRDLQFALAAGIASGDDNPNLETMDQQYSGFIGLQEIYSGKRVKSVFLLGGAGRLRRPLSTPTENQIQSRFTNTISGFSNLAFVGGALHWNPSTWDKALKVNPNTLVYWQEKSIAGARTFLGVETDIFIYYNMLEHLKFFFVASAFFPGSYYKDRSGLAIRKELDDILDRPDTTGFEGDRIPDLGNDTAFTFNFGLEYNF